MQLKGEVIYFCVESSALKMVNISQNLIKKKRGGDIWDNDEVRFVVDKHAELDLYSASSLKQQSVGKHVAPLGHIILIPR